MRTARRLGRPARLAKPRLPRALFLTDPQRVIHPLTTAAGLPQGTGVVFRAFGAPDAERTGRALAALCRRRGLVLLIGADERLAARIGADGVHLPERLAWRARRLRAERPFWIVTVAAHSVATARRAAADGADAVLLSTIFPSASPSAGRPLGPVRLAQAIRLIPAPVYGLGGVDKKNAPRLLGAGAFGWAAVSAWL